MLLLRPFQARAVLILKHLLPPREFELLLSGWSGRTVVGTVLDRLLQSLPGVDLDLLAPSDGARCMSNAIACRATSNRI